MLAKFYKTNQPLILVFLPLWVVFLWIFPSTEQETNITNCTPLFNLVKTSSPLINKIEGSIILLVSAILLNSAINRNEFFHKNTYYPSLLYVLLMSTFKETLTIHPILIANLFVILAFRRLLNIYSQLSCKSEIFDAFLFLLIATLFYLPAGLLLPAVWIVWGIFRPFNIKEFLIPFLAVGLVLIYYFSSFIFFPKMTPYSFEHFLLNSIYPHPKNVVLTNTLLIFNLILLLLGLIELFKRIKSSTIRFKKLINSVLILLLFSAFVAVLEFSKNRTPEVFLLLAPLTSLILTYFFEYYPKSKVKEFILLLFVVLSFYNIYLA